MLPFLSGGVLDLPFQAAVGVVLQGVGGGLVVVVAATAGDFLFLIGLSAFIRQAYRAMVVAGFLNSLC